MTGHKVVLDLDTGGHSPSATLDQPEHLPEAVINKSLVLFHRIGGGKHTLAH